MEEDLYDFSGVSLDLQLLQSELMTLQSARDNNAGYFSTSIGSKRRNFQNENSDDEEWYPPSPPIYDVTDKLIEINRIFQEDPTPVLREPNRLRWRSGSALVQIKWLFNDSYVSNFHQPRTTENKVIFQTENCFSQTSERIIVVEDLDSEIEDVSDDANPETDDEDDDDRSTPSPREIEIDFPVSSSCGEISDWRETKYADVIDDCDDCDVIDDDCDVTKSENHEIVLSEICESDLFNDHSITIELPEASIDQSRISPSPPPIQNDNKVKVETSPPTSALQNANSFETQSSQNDNSEKEQFSPPSSPIKNANAIKAQFLLQTQNAETRFSVPDEKVSVHRRRSSDSISLSSTLPPIHRRGSSHERIKESRSVSNLLETIYTKVPITTTQTQMQKSKGPISSSSSNGNNPNKRRFSDPTRSLPIRKSSSTIFSETSRNNNSVILLEQVHLFDDNKNIRNNGRQRTFNSNNNMNIPSTTTTTTTTATTSSTTRSSSTSRTVNPRLMTRSRSSSIRKSSTNSTSSNSSVSSQTTEETSATSTASSTDSTSSVERRIRMNSNQSRKSIDVLMRPQIEVVMTKTEAVSQWKLRKREEKRLKERKAFIEAHMRRMT